MPTRRAAKRLWAALPVVAWLVAAGCGNGKNPPPVAARAALSDYVGVLVCAECHADKVESHRTTGHAATFAATIESSAARAFCGLSLTDSPPYGRFEYSCNQDGLQVRLPQVFGKDHEPFPLQFALGSGLHAVSFLTLVPGADRGTTVGVEHRWTWYKVGEEPGITLGLQDDLPNQDIAFFGKVIPEEIVKKCVGCHTTTFEIDKTNNALTNVQANVNCEACHGPARKHVELARAHKTKDAVAAIQVKRPGPDEIALCGSCHRLPADMEPDRLQRYPPILTRFQPVGLLQSRCFKASEGRMSCSTCHDPHEPASARTTAGYESVCLSCHSRKSDRICTVSPRADCIRCHMPAIEVIPQVSFHDHWIQANNVNLKRSGTKPASPEQPVSGAPH